MPKFGSLSRKDLVRCLKLLGFERPYAGGKHEFLIKGQLRLVLPNPHQREIGKDLLARILRQAEIKRDEWERL